MKVDLPEPAMPMTMTELALGMSGRRPRCDAALVGAGAKRDDDADDDAMLGLRAMRTDADGRG